MPLENLVSMLLVERQQATTLRFGWVSFFQDMGSKMVVPILPLYLVLEFGASAFTIAAIDGAGVVTVAVVAPWAGRLTNTRSPVRLTQIGYATSSLAKGALALTWTPAAVLFVRVADRAGKGLRDAPRDLLLLSGKRSGRAMGIQQAMDKAGGVLGPLLGLAVYRVSGSSFDAVFVGALLPCIISVGLLLGLRDAVPSSGPTRTTESDVNDTTASPAQRQTIGMLGLHAGATLSTSLLILAAFSDSGSEATVLLSFAAFRAATAITSFPIGLVVDRVGATPVVTAGILLWAAAFGLAAVGPEAWPLIGLPLAGVAEALVKAPSKILVAASGAMAQRGPALGRLSSSTGWAGLAGALGAGAFWGPRGQLPLAVAAAVHLIVALWFVLGRPVAPRSPRRLR